MRTRRRLGSLHDHIARRILGDTSAFGSTIIGRVVEQVPAAETYALRHRILGRGNSPADVAAADDGAPESAHLVHKIDGRVVATGTIRRRATPAGDGRAWQIRGMAVEPDLRGRGLGASILAALIKHAEAHGGGTIWCHVRTAAVTLYERHGFRIGGPVFDDPVAGQQVLMLRDSAA